MHVEMKHQRSLLFHMLAIYNTIIIVISLHCQFWANGIHNKPVERCERKFASNLNQ